MMAVMILGMRVMSTMTTITPLLTMVALMMVVVVDVLVVIACGVFAMHRIYCWYWCNYIREVFGTHVQ